MNQKIELMIELNAFLTSLVLLSSLNEFKSASDLVCELRT